MLSLDVMRFAVRPTTHGVRNDPLNFGRLVMKRKLLTVQNASIAMPASLARTYLLPLCLATCYALYKRVVRTAYPAQGGCEG